MLKKVRRENENTHFVFSNCTVEKPALEGGEGSASRPGRSLSPGKTRYPFYRRLGGTQGRSGQVQKILPTPGFDPRTVQPVASRYTDYATRPTVIQKEGPHFEPPWKPEVVYNLKSILYLFFIPFMCVHYGIWAIPRLFWCISRRTLSVMPFTVRKVTRLIQWI
jgi:hypothetical protein